MSAKVPKERAGSATHLSLGILVFQDAQRLREDMGTFSLCSLTRPRPIHKLVSITGHVDHAGDHASEIIPD